MRLVLVCAGLLDPKWPLASPGDLRFPERAPDRLVLSPFEEAALELALRIREASGGEARLEALVCGGAETEKLARAIGAYRPDELVRLDIRGDRLWDVEAAAGAIAGRLGPDPFGAGPGLVLVPRELGDCDDGALPPYLASLLCLPCFGLAQDVRVDGGTIELMRERDGRVEWARIDRPALASVTNDRRNRLRRPLMKNVMTVRQAQYPLVPAELRLRAGLSATAAPAAARTRALGACRRLEGPIERQAAELASFLLAGVRK